MRQLFIILIAFLLTEKASIGQVLNKTELLHDLEQLSSERMAGRKPGTAGHLKAQQYIVNQLEKSNIAPLNSTYLQEFEIRSPADISGNNILGIIRGTIDEWIIISAHYDHLGVRGNEIFNGADDNASGVAALLSIADYFSNHKPKHTLIIAAFDAEESGLMGAKHFVNEYQNKNIIANINMDMISRSDTKELYVCGTYHYPKFSEWINKYKGMTGVKLKTGHDVPGSRSQDWTYSSDHGAFHTQKIPFIYFGVEDHQDYHKSTDTFDKIDQDFYYDVVRIIRNIIRDIDQNL